MTLENLHIKTYASFGRNAFSLDQFCKCHKFNMGTGKVMLNRMTNNHQIFRVKRGTYIGISPKNWLMFHELKPKLRKLATSIYEKFPDLSLLLLYGSQVRGNADKYSDYDVLVVIPKAEESSKIKKEIEKKLKIKLHLTIYSEQAFKTFVITEPYLKFWFNEGIIFDEKSLTRELNKPTAKLGYLENLEEAKTYMEMAKKELLNKKKAAFYYYKILRTSLMIKYALNLNYKYEDIKEIEDMKTTVKKIRSNITMKKEDLKKIKDLAEKTVSDVSSMMATIGENESDLYWRKTKARQ